MKKFFWIFILFLLSFFLVCCGRKTPPFSIEESMPKDFSYEIKVQPFGFEFFVFLPTSVRANYPLLKIKKLEVKKEILSLNNKLIEEKTLAVKPKIHSASNIYFFTDTDIQEGFCYKYSMRIVKDFLVKTSWVESKTVCWDSAPFPLKDFKVEKKGNIFEISWKKEKNLTYELKRKKDGKEHTFFLTQNHFVDKIEFKKFVCYTVRGIKKFQNTLIPGFWSREICFYAESFNE